MLPVKKTAIQMGVFFMVSIFLDGVTSRDRIKTHVSTCAETFLATKALAPRRFATNDIFTPDSGVTPQGSCRRMDADRDEECSGRGPDHAERMSSSCRCGEIVNEPIPSFATILLLFLELLASRR